MQATRMAVAGSEGMKGLGWTNTGKLWGIKWPLNRNFWEKDWLLWRFLQKPSAASTPCATNFVQSSGASWRVLCRQSFSQTTKKHGNSLLLSANLYMFVNWLPSIRTKHCVQPSFLEPCLLQLPQKVLSHPILLPCLGEQHTTAAACSSIYCI